MQICHLSCEQYCLESVSRLQSRDQLLILSAQNRQLDASPPLPYFFSHLFSYLSFFCNAFIFLLFLFFLYVFFSFPPSFPLSFPPTPSFPFPFSAGGFWTFLAAFTSSAFLYILSLLIEDFEGFLFNMHVSAGLFVCSSFSRASVCKAVYQTVPLHYLWRRAFVLAWLTQGCKNK